MPDKKKKMRPRWKRRGLIETIKRRLAGIPAEIQSLRAPDARSAATRRTRFTRRKRLTGMQVLARIATRLGLSALVRGQLAKGLEPRHQKHFGLQPGQPLIPIDEPPGRSRAPAVERAERMTPSERKRRVVALAEEERDLRRKLRELRNVDRDEDEPADLTDFQIILVGAVMLKWATRRASARRWLRTLLNVSLKASRDRKLFDLEGQGPLVLEDEGPAPRATGRAAKTGAATRKRRARAPQDGDASGARAGDTDGPRAAAGSGPHDGGVQPLSAEGAPAGGVDAPIPGWQPRRVPAPTSSNERSGTDEAEEWGAILRGVRRVAQLPVELCGRKITVTDSAERSWDTTVTAVVSRDERVVVVRTAGRPASS